MFNRFALALGVLAVLALPAAAAEKAPEPPKAPEAAAGQVPTPEQQFAIAEALKPSFVQVEYTLRYDKDRAPEGSGWGERCPNCGQYHSDNVRSAFQDERPFEIPGILISPTEVLLRDPVIHPRFVQEIAVRAGQERIIAHPAAYAIGHNALILRLDKPFQAAKPLLFQPAAKPPQFLVTYSLDDGEWTFTVRGFSPVVSEGATGRKFLAVPSGLIVDAQGSPVGVTLNNRLPADDAWKGSPLAWPALTADQMAQALRDIGKRFSQGILRVTLNFRSPRKVSGRDEDYSDREERTEQDTAGILLDDKRILVLAGLPPKVTARLQRITVHPADGEAIQAAFACTLKDYNAFVATLEKPLPGAPVFSKDDIMRFRDQLLLSATIELRGDLLISHYLHSRIASFDIGWKGRMFPEVPGNDGGLLLFDRDGKLVALPLSRRETVTTSDRGRYRGMEHSDLRPASHLAELLAGDLKPATDPSNVPLTEQQENRIAWLGVMLQALDRDLARINKVSELTDDGSVGAVVSYIYPGSPAAQAGIQTGDVLIRLHVEGQPEPLDVRVPESRYSSGGGFPWNRLDEVPEEYYDQIPQPWPPTENTLTRALTDLGFGKKFTAELARDGQVYRKDFTVVESPPYYESADKFKSEPLGLTVRDLTYEVRRYFQKTVKDPGVIIAKIETGSKASVSGLKPYEIITHVNGQPVMNAKEFSNLAGQGGELKLSVNRMTKGRVVTIKPGEAVPPAKQPGPEEAKPPAGGDE